MDQDNSKPQESDPANDSHENFLPAVGAERNQNNAGHTDSSRYQTEHKSRIAKWFGGHKPLEWLTFGFEVLTFFALCVYSYFSWGQWQAMRDQNGVMEGQLEHMKDTHLLMETERLATNAEKQARATNQLAAESKRSADIAQGEDTPWLGIEQDSFAIGRLEYSWDTEPPLIRIYINFALKNFGTSPALNAYQDITVRAVRGSPLPYCTISNGRGLNLGNDMILPGETRRFGWGPALRDETPTVTNLGAVWVTICISYLGPHDRWHHSGYAFMNAMSTSRADDQDNIVGGPHFFLRPVHDGFLAEPRPPQKFPKAARWIEGNRLRDHLRRPGGNENVITGGQEVLGMGHAPDFDGSLGVHLLLSIGVAEKLAMCA